MFFQKFPLIDYDMYGTQEYVLATNIMKRFRIRRSIVDNRSFFYNYELMDGERPEILAHKFYGRPDLHWLVLMTNDIRDPYEDWPMDQQSLLGKTEKKYPGTSLFLWNEDLRDEYPQETPTQPHSSQLRVGDEIEWVDVTQNEQNDESTVTPSGVKSKIIKWDAEYSRLVIDKQINWPTNKYFNNNTQGIALCGYNLKTVAHSSQSIHHWEESYTLPGRTTVVKNKVNPLDLDRTTALDADTPEESATRRYRDAYIVGQTSLEFSLDFPPLTKNLKVITNEQHEINENDNRRKIKIIKPEFVEDILADLEEVFNR